MFILLRTQISNLLLSLFIIILTFKRMLESINKSSIYVIKIIYSLLLFHTYTHELYCKFWKLSVLVKNKYRLY
jgi:hypothetical protein